MSTRAWAIVMALMLGGCAFGNESNYQNATPTLQIATTNEIALGVHDQRPNVVSGRNSLTYTGVTRSRAGIPYGVHTKSGRPLADDFSTAIANGLAEKQIR